MMSRRFWRVLATGCVAASLAGCDPVHRQTVRSTADDLIAESQPESQVTSPPESKGFFKKNIASGGWSSEAREIEQNLGAAN